MAITPPSDIVLGVAQAADPLKQQQAAARLLRAGGLAPGATAASETAMLPSIAKPAAPPETSWATVVEQVAADTANGAPAAPVTARMKEARSTPEAYRQFEAFVLQSFIESMLPDGAEHVFGKGTAGEVWKSMLAEQLALEISRSGGIGIAKRIAASGEAAAAGRPAIPAADRS